MPSGPKKRRASRKKNNYNANTSSTNLPDEAVSEMGCEENKGKELKSLGEENAEALHEKGFKENKGKDCESVDDLEFLVNPMLKETEGNKQVDELTVNNLSSKETANTLVESVLIEKSQDSFKEPQESSLIDQPAIVDQDSNEKIKSELLKEFFGEQFGRLKTMLDELVCYSENQIKVAKEIIRILDEITTAGKPWQTEDVLFEALSTLN